MKHLLCSLGLVALAACNKGATKDAPPTPPTPAVVATNPSGTPGVAASTAVVVEAAPSGTLPGGLRYAVRGVAANDVLNVREKPDVASKKVYSFGPTAKNIRFTGAHMDHGGTPWVEVAFEGGTGWVNRSFLTEQHAGGGCNDPAVPALIRAFMKAITDSDGAALQACASPLNGLTVAPEAKRIHLAYADLNGLFTSKALLNAGAGDGRGPDITGRFEDLVGAKLRSAILKKGAQEECGEILAGKSTTKPPTVADYAPLTPVSFFYPGTPESNDWLTWIGAIEYFDGKPYFVELDQVH